MREFLKGLELDKETIDSIMAEVGKHHQGLKEQIETYKEQIDDYKKQTEEYQNQRKDYEEQIEQLYGKIEDSSKDLETLQNLTNENKSLKAQIQMSDSNVRKEFMKFVGSEVSSQVNDETDFATALENYKKDNPQYFGEPVVKKVQTSPKLNNASGGTSTNNIMNDVIRQAVNK